MIFYSKKYYFAKDNEPVTNIWQYLSKKTVLQNIRNFTYDYVNSDELKYSATIFVGELGKKTITLSMAIADKNVTTDIFIPYMKGLTHIFHGFLLVCKSPLKEIDYLDFCNYLDKASDHKTIDEDDYDGYLLNQYSCGYYAKRILFYDKVIEPKNEKSLTNKLKDEYFGDALLKEIDNIYKTKPDKYLDFHPVHYIFETDFIHETETSYEALISALYSNNRVRSKRYICIDVRRNFLVNGNLVNKLYKNIEGGTVVLKFHGDTEEDFDLPFGPVDEGRELIGNAFLFNDDIQFIFVIPKNNEELMDEILKYFEDIPLIKFNEVTLNKKDGNNLIKAFAEDQQEEANQIVMDIMKEDREYSINEIIDKYSQLYLNKMHKEHFPCYLDIKPVILSPKKENRAYDEFMSLTGQSNVKSLVDKIISYYMVNKIYEKRDIVSTNPALHIAFSGASGCGKSTVAGLLGETFCQNNILSKGHIVEAGFDLIGKYMGHTAQIVKEKIKEAKGGILFIDRADELFSSKDSYTMEAVNTLTQMIENIRHDTVVVFSGVNMENCMNKNPGLRSRIAFHVTFSDYSIDELMDIAIKMANKQKLILSKGVDEKLRALFIKAMNTDNYGQGRYVRYVLEQARLNLAVRLSGKDLELLDNETLTTIIPEDIPDYVNMQKTEKIIGYVK